MIAALLVMSDMDLPHDLLGYGWVGSIEFESNWFGSWYAAGAMPMCMSLGLATSGMHVSVDRFRLQV
jgi:hypothetical protein